MQLLDGRKIRDEIKNELRAKVGGFSSKPKLVIIQIGDNEESATYITQKKVFGESIGVLVEHLHFTAETSGQDVLAAIGKLNTDSSVHGIIVQIPIPEQLDKDTII